MKPEKPRCSALSKDGKPCGAAPTSTGLCFFHGNPNRAAELGRLGGKLNRRRIDESAHSESDGMESAEERLESLYRRVETGSLSPVVANTLMKLTDLQARVREKTAIEQQIAELQEQLRTLKSMINLQEVENPMFVVEADEDKP